ncbi:hypothetical protein [Undibacterium sp.]|jgi:hypothetical protein|uniref:hypothetical protein n=1 Tax=Undibacterium sp. TaxID=1914977 RepID=UPI002B815836|nr:hypothetical protein [Undibacterium sp.]HTD05879.1 hypothetical protein [Undibacterium sp.]
MTTSEPRWLHLVREEAARTSIAAVARRLDYSRTSISLVLDGKYPGKTGKIETKAIAVLEPAITVACPYVSHVIPVEMCQDYSTRRAPTHNPTLMGQWRACQQCQNKCKGETQ